MLSMINLGGIWTSLLIFLVVILGIEISLELALSDNFQNGWYATMKRPSWMTPPKLFSWIWSFLYGCMAISIWLIWKKHQKAEEGEKGFALAYLLFAIQLFLITAWPIIFFLEQSYFPALLIALVLWFVLLITIMVFRKYSKIAFWLLIPVHLWVTYTIALNLAICWSYCKNLI
jgi:tryptophan-rich sensory protein